MYITSTKGSIRHKSIRTQTIVGSYSVDTSLFTIISLQDTLVNIITGVIITECESWITATGERAYGVNARLDTASIVIDALIDV